MFSTRQIVCHLPADSSRWKKNFPDSKTVAVVCLQHVRAYGILSREKTKKIGSTTSFFLGVEWWLVTETLPMLQIKFSYGISFQ